MAKAVKTDTAAGKADASVENQTGVAELEVRLAAVEKYLGQLKQHGHLPAMRSDQ
jgi:hypothetical protein